MSGSSACWRLFVVVVVVSLGYGDVHLGAEYDLVVMAGCLQREMPIGEQLVQLKDTAKTKINQFADQNNLNFEQPQNDPSNK